MAEPSSALGAFKKEQSRKTRAALEAALSRLEAGSPKVVRPGTKLTRSSFERESGIATETAFSRYRDGHTCAGEYRYPDIVRRFLDLREKLGRRGESTASRERREVDELRDRIKEMRGTIDTLDEQILQSRRVALELDGLVRDKDREIAGLRERIVDLEAALAQARQKGIHELPRKKG